MAWLHGYSKHFLLVMLLIYVVAFMQGAQGGPQDWQIFLVLPSFSEHLLIAIAAFEKQNVHK